jgi:hypothetical protein
MEGCAAHAPAMAGIDILMDMGLIEIDRKRSFQALGNVA